MKKGVLIALLLVLAWTPLAHADMYAGLYGGGAWLQDSDLEGKDNLAGTNVKDIEWDTGWLAGGKVGGWMKSLPWVALEGNVWYSQVSASGNATLEEVGVGTAAVTDLELDADQVNFALSILLQYPTGRIRPYVGGGIVGSWLQISTNASGDDPESDTFGYGGMGQAGVEFMVTPMIGLFGEYRYIWTTYSFDEEEGDNNFDIDIQGHNFLAGLSVRF
jgi:opacity protein-like surface antigen